MTGTRMGMAWRRHWLAVSAAVVVVLAACSGGAEDSESETAISPPTTDTITTPATEPTTTTSSTAEPTTSTTSVEDAVREVHTRYMTELSDVDERLDGSHAFVAAAREITTGPLLHRIEETAAARQATGEVLVGPGYLSHIVSVEIEGDRATVVDCSLGRGELLDADGAVVVPADESFKLRTSVLILLDGAWLIEDFFVGGDAECDPEAVR
jgi:hypothetical protein